MEITIFSKENLGTVRAMVYNDKPYFFSKDLYKAIESHFGYLDLLCNFVDCKDGRKMLDNGELTIVLDVSGVDTFLGTDFKSNSNDFRSWFESEIVPVMVFKALGIAPENVAALDSIKCYHTEDSNISRPS